MNQEINFCVRCGSKLILQDRDGIKRPVCPDCNWVHYDDPKVATGCLIFDDSGRVLLVQRSIEPVGLWTFPGGFMDRFEDPIPSAKREILEETGMDVEIESLLNIYRAPQSPVLLLVYFAKPTSDSPAAQALHECQDIGYFAEAEVPWEQLAFHSTVAALKEGFRR